MKGEFHLYPEGNAPKLREKLAEYLETDPRRIIFGNGSDELIQMIGRHLSGTGDGIGDGRPHFPTV